MFIKVNLSLIKMLDFVFPHNNEEDFLRMGRSLGFDNLVFIYDYGVKIAQAKEKIKEFGLLALPKNIKNAKKHTKYVLVQNPDRHVIEKNTDFVAFNLENTGKRDFIHHRASGLNHTACRFASQNNVTMAFSFNLILDNKGEQRSKIIGRMKQNIRICNKYKVKTILASFASDPYEMRSPKDLEAVKRILSSR